jgi:branched-chain amino acid transport system ATP-binding protein
VNEVEAIGDGAPELQADAKRTPTKVAAHALQLEGVGRRFGGLVAVNDLTLSITRGERRAILGPNGAGKTTLFNLIAGDYRPTTGHVLFFDEDVTHLPPRKRARRGLARTYQTALLFLGLDILDNLYLAVRGVRSKRMSMIRPQQGDPYLQASARLAERVGLGAVLHRKVGDLSHGEQRQLELGMALASNPKLLMLDEPAAGLSPGERGTLINLLLGLDPEITVLLIEHDMDVAFGVARRVTVMHEGRIIADGTPHEIRNDQTVQAVYLGGSGTEPPSYGRHGG